MIVCRKKEGKVFKKVIKYGLLKKTEMSGLLLLFPELDCVTKWVTCPLPHGSLFPCHLFSAAYAT